jgi:hypothetical protein
MQFTLSWHQIQKLELKYRQIHGQVTATIANRILVVLALVDLGKAAKVDKLYKLDERVRFVVILDCIRKAELMVFLKFIIRVVNLI